MKIYRKIWYFEQGNSQIARIIGKGPEIMAMIYLFEKITNIIVNRTLIITFGLSYILLCFSTGVFYKKSGLYDKERSVQANQDPIQKELLENSRETKEMMKKCTKNLKN